MAHQQLHRLSDPVDVRRDHVLGNLQAPITLLEYGSYACRYCHAAHEVIANLRDHFGDRMRYVFRHLPIAGDDIAEVAADLAEYAHETRDNFWEVHDALMKAGPVFDPDDLVATGQSFDIPDRDAAHEEHWQRAEARVRSNIESARYSGAHVTPTFFINGRRYEGPWDESSLSEAMLGSLGHRVHAAALDFARWAPSTGLLLLVMVILAVIIANTGVGPAFENFWQMPFGMMAGEGAFAMPLREWINDALLTIFFLVVGLEIKREFTIGRLASFQAGALPVAAALGGMTVPALTYLLITFDSPFVHGWGIPIATDTAFAIALIAVLGRRVPVELRVFLTAAAIVDDLAVIVIIAIFYSGDLQWLYLIAALAATGLLAALNHAGVYRALPYALTGLALWIFLHSAGVHATLAGVILALFTPTRPPANLTALLSQAEAVLKTEMRLAGDKVLRHGPSEPALRSLDAIHDRIESPADKLLRSIEPWSSYVVLPLFAFANAGVVMSVSILSGHELLMLGIVLGLIIGKPAGIVLAAWLAVRLGIAVKPAAYTWQQMIGAGALAGIGFTMSLFIAGQAFADASAFAAAKIAIFIASMTAAVIGTLLVLRKPAITDDATSTTAAQPP